VDNPLITLSARSH